MVRATTDPGKSEKTLQIEIKQEKPEKVTETLSMNTNAKLAFFQTMDELVAVHWKKAPTLAFLP